MTAVQTKKLTLAEDYLMTLKNYAWLEGNIPYMYLDGKGYVTVGIGHLLVDAGAAKKLSFDDPKTKAKAEEKVIQTTYDWVKAQTKALPADQYKNKDNNYITLPPEEIDKLAISDIDGKIALVEPIFGISFNKFPRNAQKGLLDIWYNVASPKMTFPNFIQAVKDSDWSQAAFHSHRKPVDKGIYARNTLVAVWFCQLAEEVAAAKAKSEPKKSDEKDTKDKKESFYEKFKKDIQAKGWDTLEAVLADLEKYQKTLSGAQNSKILEKLMQLDEVYKNHKS